MIRGNARELLAPDLSGVLRDNPTSGNAPTVVKAEDQCVTRLLSKLVIAALSLLLAGTGTHTHSAEQLVEITALLDPASDAVPGQRVRLEVTVATPRWFTAGTKIKLPEVPGLVLLQNQDFAANATEIRNGTSWTVQRWFIDVFATRAGEFAIPPLSVTVAVSRSPSETHRETLKTPGLTLQVEVPEALQDLDHWVASPSVSVKQTVDGDLAMAPGAALSRRVTIKASDVMAMFLPGTETPELDLLSGFPEPPILRNKANRGRIEATRSDRVTWIATQNGEVDVPGVTVNWWNTETRTLKVLATETLRVSVSGAVMADAEPVNKGRILWGALAGVVALFAGIILYRWQPWTLLNPAMQWLLGAGKNIVSTFKGSRLPGQLNPGGSRSREP